jgi:hypothetical protein
MAPTYRISQLIAIVVAAVGGSVMLGWILDITTLKSIFPGSVEMKFNTAASFLLTGACLAMANAAHKPLWLQLLINFLAAAVVLLAVTTLVEYYTGRDLHVDQAFFRDVARSNPGRMSPLTAVNFVLMGGGAAIARGSRPDCPGSDPVHGIHHDVFMYSGNVGSSVPCILFFYDGRAHRDGSAHVWGICPGRSGSICQTLG